MRSFFHFSPLRLQKKARNIVLITACFSAEICIAAFFVLFFNFLTARNYNVIFQMLTVTCAVIPLGMLISLLASELFRHKIRRGSRYTYVDIQLKTVIFSAYAGEYRVSGEKIIVRDIYYMPFSDISDISVGKNGKGVILSGNFRHYCMNSDNLGYHVKDGEVIFDRPLLSEACFENVSSVHIPDVFGKPETLCKALKEGREQFDEIPAPKPYVFKEADFIRRRAKPRVMPEDFNYSRKW